MAPIQPVRYTSQFDPAAEQLTQQVLRERSNRFEQSFANIAQEQAKQGEMFFLDEQAKQQTLSRFNAEKDQILDKYEGDYEAAAPELTKLIVKERNNPIYNLNKYQQQKIGEYQQIVNRMGAENALVVKAPTTSLYDKETGQLKSIEDFDYEVYDRSKIQAKGAQWLSQIKPKERALELDRTGQFYRQVKEITSEDFANNLTDEKISKFLETTPELARIAESQGEDPITFAKEYLISEGQGIVGIHDIQYIANREYIPVSERKTTAFSGYEDLPNITRIREVENVLPEEPEAYTEAATGGVKGIVNIAASLGKGIISGEYAKEADRVRKEAEKEWEATEGQKKWRDQTIGKQEYANRKVSDWRRNEGLVFTNAKNRDKVTTFAQKHEELIGLPAEQVARAYNDINQQFSAEFSKTHIPSRDFNTEESDFVFITKNGETGNLFKRKLTAYIPGEEESLELIGKEKAEEFYKLITGQKDLTLKDRQEALKSMGVTGITFTGTTPASIMAQSSNNVTFEVENTNPSKKAGSTVWGLAEAIRSDNNSQLLDSHGPSYGISKNEAGVYEMPNYNSRLRKLFGIDMFTVENDINLNPNTGRYEATPTIRAYDNSGKELDFESPLTMDILIAYTKQDLIDKGLIQTE